MKKIKITTPENIEVEYTLADMASRTAAALIDTLIQGLVFLLLGIGVLIIARFSPTFWEKYYGWIIGISLLVYMAVSYGYFIVMELAMNGMTVGKKILKLRTIRNNGQPVTLKHSAVRNLFRIFVDMYGVGIVWIFFSKERKRLGDLAASTIVVAEQDKNRPVTLESLQRMNEHFRYYISEEEAALLREYLERRNGMEDASRIREELKLHLTEKFKASGVLDEWAGFINEL